MRPGAEDVSVVDVVDPLPDRLLVLGLQDLLGAGGDSGPGLPLVRMTSSRKVMLVSYCVGPPGTARLKWLPGYGEELAVLVEDRVGPQAGLEGVGPAPGGSRRTWSGGRGCARA